MSFFGELMLRGYMRLLPRRRSTRGGSANDYHQWQYDTSESMFRDFPEFDFKGKRVLELGCGIGGRSIWLAKNGAADVVGIDINRAEIDEANRLRAERFPELQNVSFHACLENEPLESVGAFDHVLLLDSLEHVVSPLKVVMLAGRYAKPGGKVYFTTMGWYHHAGSHVGIPFANVFFSDETILNAMRWWVSRPDYVRSIWDTDPPVARWEGIYNLRDRPGEYLNKITIGEIKKLVKYAPFRKGEAILLGFRNRKLRWLNPLRHVPILNEVMHAGVIGFLQK